MIPLLVGFACLAVPGDTIRAEDLAARVPELSTANSGAVFGFSTKFGVTRTIAPSEIRRFAAQHGVTIDNAPEVCVVRPSRFLTEDEVESSLAKAIDQLPAGAREAEIVEFSRQPVPEGTLEFAASGWSANRDIVIWRGAVVTSGGGRHPVWVKLRLPEAASVLRKTRVTAQRDIKAGDPVEVLAIYGNARLKLEAIAETSGFAGGRVLLKNKESGQRFSATISGPGRAVVGEQNAIAN